MPSFVLNGHFLFSGAQPAATMASVLLQASIALLAMDPGSTPAKQGAETVSAQA